MIALMKLTRELILAARTSKGGWTRAQLEVIGVAWPPTYGWQNRAIGREMTEEEYLRFCDRSEVRGKASRHSEHRQECTEKRISTGEPVAANDLAELIEQLRLERVARTELQKHVEVLQLQLDVLCNEVRVARTSPTDHDSGHTHSLSRKTHTTPPWET